jgi:hypothetical protein
MTRFMLIVVVSTCIGLASSTRLGLFGLLVVSGAYLAILVAIPTSQQIGFAAIAVSMVVVQCAYVLGGWLFQPSLRQLLASGGDGDREEDDR